MIYYSKETDQEEFLKTMGYSQACFASTRLNPQRTMGIKCKKVELAEDIVEEWNNTYTNLPLKLGIYSMRFEYKGAKVSTGKKNFVVVTREFEHLNSLDSAWLIPFMVVRLLDESENFYLGGTKTLRGLIMKGMTFAVHNICNPGLPAFSAIRCINDIDFLTKEKDSILKEIDKEYGTSFGGYPSSRHYGLRQSQIIKALGGIYARKRRH